MEQVKIGQQLSFVFMNLINEPQRAMRNISKQPEATRQRPRQRSGTSNEREALAQTASTDFDSFVRTSSRR